MLAVPKQLINWVVTWLVRTPGGPMIVDGKGPKLAGNEIYALEFAPTKFPLILIVDV